MKRAQLLSTLAGEPSPGVGQIQLALRGNVSRTMKVCWWQVVARGGGGVERLKERILFGL